MENKIFFEESEAVGSQKDKISPAGRPATKVQPLTPLQLHWPTDYRVVTQSFGANPELVSQRNLPGHEGLDIRAPLNAKVYACADGVVEAAQERILEGDPYGRWVRILHSGGARTLYGHLGNTSVQKGAKVKARQVLGLAGPTGDTAGGHIHLSLMLEGATGIGLTQYPDDLVDPSPFLAVTPPPKNTFTYPWPVARTLPGSAADLNGDLLDRDFFAKASSPPEALRLNLQTSPGKIAQLRKGFPNVFFMTSLHLPARMLSGRASEWVAQVRPLLKNHIDAGISYFEVHHAPNLAMEGCFAAWQSGHEFARWWIDAVTMLKQSYPVGRFGFPGLANGAQVPGQRLDADTFLEQADQALLLADWIGVHCYWGNNQELMDEVLGARELRMRRWYPDKLLFVTEFGNLNSLTDENAKSRDYLAFLEKVQKDPGIGAAFLNVA